MVAVISVISVVVTAIVRRGIDIVRIDAGIFRLVAQEVVEAVLQEPAVLIGRIAPPELIEPDQLLDGYVLDDGRAPDIVVAAPALAIVADGQRLVDGIVGRFQFAAGEGDEIQNEVVAMRRREGLEL